MPKRLHNRVCIFTKKTAIVQLLLTKFESTKITKKGQPILGQDKTTGEFNNLMQQMINYIFVELWKKHVSD